METSSSILLVVSCAVSFGVGRLFVHFRDKRRAKREQALEATADRNRPVERESLNKAKRKRQQQAQGKKKS